MKRYALLVTVAFATCVSISGCGTPEAVIPEKGEGTKMTTEMTEGSSTAEAPAPEL